MQCPHCGNEVSGAMLCSKCGKEVDPPKRDIEVEYKEFTISELLEIRKSHKASPAEGTTDPGRAEKDGPPSPQPPAKVTGKPAPGRGAKRLLIALFLIFVILGLVAGAYYFLRFLF